MRRIDSPSRLVTTAGIAAGVVLVVYGVLGDRRIDVSDLRAIGTMLLTLGGAHMFHVRSRRPIDVAYSLGRDEGWRDGYEAGRLVARPVVVPLRRYDGAAAPVGPGLAPAIVGQE